MPIPANIKRDNAKAFLRAWSDKVIEQAKLELRVTRRRYKYSHEKGRVGQYRGKIDNTGNLRKSLEAALVARDKKGRFTSANGVEFRMDEYGTWVDMGRRKGKGAPPQVIRDWLRSPKMRLRDPETGQLMAKTDKNIKSAGYLINRKLKYFGIDATHFFAEPFEAAIGALEKGLTEAMALDIEAALISGISGKKGIKIEDI